jgi:hypothetical protein
MGRKEGGRRRGAEECEGAAAQKENEATSRKHAWLAATAVNSEGNRVQTIPPVAKMVSFGKTPQRPERHLIWVWREYISP